METIDQVVQNSLCNSCGACFAVCKSDAIKFAETISGYYFPTVDAHSCVQCGLCFSVCPGRHFCDLLKNEMSDDPFSGKALNAFVGKATDKLIYENSQSGGIVTALVTHLLDSGLADRAVTVTMDWGNPPRPRSSLSCSADDISAAQKSKYCPVPTLASLKDVIGSDQRIVFVGTSCQVHGLFNMMDKIPSLRVNVVLIVGLVCDRVMTYAATDYLVRKAGLSGNDDQMMMFRDKTSGGYPGNVHVQAVGGQSRVLPASTRMLIKDYFTPARCRICFDKMNIFADITVGDPHGLKDVDREMGESVFVVRTEVGRSAVASALSDSFINTRNVDYADVLAGQNIKLKKKQWSSYSKAWGQLGKIPPDYYALIKTEPLKFADYTNHLLYALHLDDFESRDALFLHVDKALKFKVLWKRLLSPFRFAKWVVEKMIIRKA